MTAMHAHGPAHAAAATPTRAVERALSLLVEVCAEGEISLTDCARKVGLSGGLAGAIVDADVTWSETVTIAGRHSPVLTGGGHNTDLLWGFYVGGNVAFQISERWSAILGVQYQDVGTYSHSFSGRQVDANLGHSVFMTAGLGWSF